jgi:hypothetical protein
MHPIGSVSLENPNRGSKTRRSSECIIFFISLNLSTVLWDGFYYHPILQLKRLRNRRGQAPTSLCKMVAEAGCEFRLFAMALCCLTCMMLPLYLFSKLDSLVLKGIFLIGYIWFKLMVVLFHVA